MLKGKRHSIIILIFIGVNQCCYLDELLWLYYFNYVDRLSLVEMNAEQNSAKIVEENFVVWLAFAIIQNCITVYLFLLLFFFAS